MVKHTLIRALAVCAVVAGAVAVSTERAQGTPRPSVGHVFIINLENKGFEATFGASSPAPYLSQQLRAQGQLLTQYHATAHFSLPNYIAQISGQGPNFQTQIDCQVYSDFTVTGSTVEPQQAVGSGCVYPSNVRTIADQLEHSGRTWRGYMEDMGTPCRHPQLGTVDETLHARLGDQYAARHNPFLYFHSIVDSASCVQNDVDLSHLPTDLQDIATTPNLSYITPNLCNDGHDSPCVDGRPGGLISADAWLAEWVPQILASPAFQQDGMLVVTFDEAEYDSPDGSAACCGEGPGPNAALPGLFGLGGGRTGAVVVSPFAVPGSVNDTPYNHYSLLRTMEDIFHLPPLGYAQYVCGFGRDVLPFAR